MAIKNKVTKLPISNSIDAFKYECSLTFSHPEEIDTVFDKLFQYNAPWAYLKNGFAVDYNIICPVCSSTVNIANCVHSTTDFECSNCGEQIGCEVVMKKFCDNYSISDTEYTVYIGTIDEDADAAAVDFLTEFPDAYLGEI